MSESSCLMQNDLVSSKNGGRILFASDDFFAVAENLIKHDEPEWREKEYTPFGKWMDGWETRRKRKAGHDFCIIQLAAEAAIEVVDVDTAFFTGNFPPAISIQGTLNLNIDEIQKLQRESVLGSEAKADQEIAAKSSDTWMTILDTVALRPGLPETRHNQFLIEDRPVVKYLRLNLFPDGGVARLRVYGEPVFKPYNDEPRDVAAFLNNGQIIAFSNAHFGHPKNLIAPGESTGMHDGWETARQKDRPKVLERLPDGSIKHTGSEWVIIKFPLFSVISTVIVNTQHFKGNYPDSVQIEASHTDEDNWHVIVPFAQLKGDTEHRFEVTTREQYKFIRVTILPDGGISRLRVIGVPLVEN